MIYGYARVSTKEQNLDRQLKQLNDSGCDKIFEEKISGATTERPELQNMLSVLQPGDRIIVSDLTRISRSSKDLFELIEVIKEKGAALKSLKDIWLDMTEDNPYSTFLLTVMAGVNQLERDITRMRQKEGIAIAKDKGRYVGRTKKYHDKHAGMNHAIELYQAGSHTIKEISEITNVSKSALYRKLATLKDKQSV
ncbi:recombinase family protein [Priestia filamentosa]|uniref:recombinase family protein n=1 Tax=Priestia TaxID=2800373 RepID=UPI001FB1C267|nr:recombinase family protein [Priestia filamentosa]UOE62894.1 recombinase family protein [Priestia filamentosa]